MTSEKVRVFRADDDFEQERVAVWGGTEWIELEVDSVTVIDSERGALASVILPCHVGHDLATPAFAKKPGHGKCMWREGYLVCFAPQTKGSVYCEDHARAARASTIVMDQAREQVEAHSGQADLNDLGAETRDVKPPQALPAWGDTTKRVRFFKITTEDGKVFPNQSTDVAGSDAKAADHIRSRWNKLAQGQNGRAAAKVELQPDGRTGSDRPDLAPPPPRSSPLADEDGPDLTTSE